MRISSLQKYILKKIWEDTKLKVDRNKFNEFYSTQKKAPIKELQTKIITQSIERLINKGLLVGFGESTRSKWFIKEVKLTLLGKKLARKLHGEQVELPFKKRRTPVSLKTNQAKKKK